MSRLGPAPARILPLLAAIASAGCVAGGGHDGRPPASALEAESSLAGEMFEVSGDTGAAACASRGRAVPLGERPVVLRGRVPPSAGVLWLRLSCAGDAAGAQLAIEIDGSEAAVVEVPDTLHRERFEWVRAGTLAAALPLAPSERTCVVRQEGGGRVLLDQWAVVAEDRTPDPAWSPGVWRASDGSIELRAAADARLADPDWILQVVREQRDCVADLLGARLLRPLVVIALPAERWPVGRAGAFQNGCAVFLRDDELHLPWRSYAHEIAHLHEEERGLELPWFLSEGIACALALEIEARILGTAGPVAEKAAALDALLAAGDERHRPGDDGVNAALLVEADPADESARARSHAWATAVLREAAARGGPGFWRRLEGVLRDEATRSARLDLAAAAAALSRAAATPLDDLFARAGLPPP